MRRSLIAALILIIIAEALAWFLWIKPANVAVERWQEPDVVSDWGSVRNRYE